MQPDRTKNSIIIGDTGLTLDPDRLAVKVRDEMRSYGGNADKTEPLYLSNLKEAVDASLERSRDRHFKPGISNWGIFAQYISKHSDNEVLKANYTSGLPRADIGFAQAVVDVLQLDPKTTPGLWFLEAEAKTRDRTARNEASKSEAAAEEEAGPTASGGQAPEAEEDTDHLPGREEEESPGRSLYTLTFARGSALRGKQIGRQYLDENGASDSKAGNRFDLILKGCGHNVDRGSSR
jgi:hypothetical protein